MIGKRIILFILIPFFSGAQVAPSKFFISFRDKNNNPFSISNPSAFLSAKALERRTRQNIPILENDLPVNTNYIDSVAATGAVVINRSKWLNGVTVQCDSSTLVIIQAFPFVLNTIKVARIRHDGVTFDKFNVVPDLYNHGAELLRVEVNNFGGSFNQIHMMNGEFLHKYGFTGAGMTIAVLDAGFYRVDSLPAFDSLRNNNQILGTWDFVANEASVYEDYIHGEEVLSCIAGNIPGQLVGTAPKASFWLLRSEDAPTENIIEEYNWVSAAEFADSAGADIISSSLGYTTFDDPAMDHTYADMNGHTCPSSIGADAAASKGMLVLNSAGNAGGSFWNYIVAPSDGDSVLAVGAVDAYGHKASFSSFGPSSDGDVKPNVAAKGLQTTISVWDGSISQGSGTSFSCPVLAGSAACLWQAHPEKTNMEIFHAIQQSANYYNNPGDSLGYGIPDFMKADQVLGGIRSDPPDDRLIDVYPNPFRDKFQIDFYSATTQTIDIEITDVLGRLITQKKEDADGGYFSNFIFNFPGNAGPGIYFLRIFTNQKYFVNTLEKF